MKTRPASLPTHTARARELLARRAWTEAEAELTAALAARPDDFEARIAMSQACAGLDRYLRGRDFTVAAAQPVPGPADPERLLALVQRLRVYNESGLIRDGFARLPPLGRIRIPTLLGLAGVASAINDQDTALRLLDEALRGDPDYPPALAAHAQVLGYFGRRDEAERDLEKCLKRAPRFAHAHWLLARLRRQSPDSHHIDRLRRQLDALPVGPHRADEALLAFALHKELDDLGEHAAAWQALQRGCIAKRATVAYDPAASRALVDALVEWRADEAVPSFGMDMPFTPVFIVGMHRSGTSLLEHLLAGHTDVAAGGELYDFTAQLRLATDHHCRGALDLETVRRSTGIDWRAAGEGYLQSVRWRARGKPFLTDKLPSNFLNAGFIATALPGARIVHMRRAPMDSCLSNLRELFSDACPYSYDQAELADYYLQYERLMHHWRTVMPGRILDVSYAELVTDTANCLRRVMSFCGLAEQPLWAPGRARPGAVATASSAQVRERVHAGSLGGWRRYAPWLGTLRAALDETAAV